MKPSWWDKDFSAELNSFVKLIGSWFGNLTGKLSYKKALIKGLTNTNSEWERRRIEASKAEWMLLDAAQKEFERTGIKQNTSQDSGAGFYRVNSLEEVNQLIQKLAEEQRKFGKQYNGPDPDER